MPVKECPQCGETMKLKTSEKVDLIPGHPNATARIVREWVCPECDHFEEVEEKRP
jgi:acetone carboxylase gamma subunit